MSQPAGGAPAPQFSGSSSGPSGSQAGQAPAGGGDPGGSFDPSEALSEIRRSRGATQKLQSQFDSHRTETESDRQTLKRLKDAISPQESAPDPVADLESQMDYYLEQAMEAKQRGQAMPLTTNLAIRYFQSEIARHKETAELRAAIAELKGGVDHATDPSTPVNNMAYSQMETYLQQSLDQLYGTDEGSFANKRRVYQAVTSGLSQDLKQLQKVAPEKWDMLRRNPSELQKIVAHAIRSIVPPKAMGMIEQEQLQNTPMSLGEYWGAFRELKALPRSQERDAEMVKIRQHIIHLTNGPKGNRKR